MKRKTAALYDPYLDVMGGGERHILSILQVLEQQGYEVTIFWDHNLSGEIKSRLNLNFKNLTFKPNFFSFPSPFEKLKQLATYDLFFYVTDGSYFLSSAKKNYVFCMVPDRKLYQMGITNKLKTLNYEFIANSNYTQGWLNQWNIDSKVIYPYISQDLINTNVVDTVKGKVILSVGRFFPHLHAKRQDAILDAFDLFSKEQPDFKLIIAGGLKKEDEEFYETLKEKASRLPNVILKPNVAYPELLELYRKSMFFWHFTGYGIDENIHPDQVEHLGMTPLEAMAAGTIPFCYSAGGPKEIISDGENGYLFRTQNELLEKMNLLLANPEKYKKMQVTAQQTVKNKFGYDVFKTNVVNILIK